MLAFLHALLKVNEDLKTIGALAGLAAVPGLGVLSLLYFGQAREVRRLREWAGRAPERAAELEARVSADAARRLQAQPAPRPATAPATPAGKGNGVATAPAPGPRPRAPAPPVPPRPPAPARATPTPSATIPPRNAPPGRVAALTGRLGRGGALAIGAIVLALVVTGVVIASVVGGGGGKNS